MYSIKGVCTLVLPSISGAVTEVVADTAPANSLEVILFSAIFTEVTLLSAMYKVAIAFVANSSAVIEFAAICVEPTALFAISELPTAFTAIFADVTELSIGTEVSY